VVSAPRSGRAGAGDGRADRVMGDGAARRRGRYAQGAPQERGGGLLGGDQGAENLLSTGCTSLLSEELAPSTAWRSMIIILPSRHTV
jgi:hypothetical protein